MDTPHGFAQTADFRDRRSIAACTVPLPENTATITPRTQALRVRYLVAFSELTMLRPFSKPLLILKITAFFLNHDATLGIHPLAGEGDELGA